MVPAVGALVGTGDRWEPYRLVDCDGAPVEAVALFFRELQAAGRSGATVRSYGLDLLRWFRFLWVIEVGWDRATRVEARDFCRWLSIAGKPPRPHGRNRSSSPTPTGQPYAASVRAHSETVLRCFYDFHLSVAAMSGPR
ncbi:site-specific integrase [Nocardia gipuzkoensis]